MKEYLLGMYQPEGPLPDPEFLADIMLKLGALRQELEASGNWVFGNGLHGTEATTVLRPGNGEVLATDGPFAEGKEYLGGITIIKADDLDAALVIAGKYVTITRLPIEVRPFQGEIGG